MIWSYILFKVLCSAECVRGYRFSTCAAKLWNVTTTRCVRVRTRVTDTYIGKIQNTCSQRDWQFVKCTCELLKTLLKVWLFVYHSALQLSFNATFSIQQCRHSDFDTKISIKKFRYSSLDTDVLVQQFRYSNFNAVSSFDAEISEMQFRYTSFRYCSVGTTILIQQFRRSFRR